VRIVDVDDAMEALGASEADRALVERALDWATATIERETATAWRIREETRTYDAPPQRGAELGRILDLESFVYSVSEVKIGDTVVTDYILLPKRGQLFRRGGWLEGLGLNNITVTALYGVGGDGEGQVPVPDDVVQACIDLVRYKLRGEDSDVVSERIGDYSYNKRGTAESFIPGIPTSVAKVLIDRRRW
jgi:hypothetical protein